MATLVEWRTGKVKPFSQKDDGGDLVETSYLAQGLLCVRQYFKDGNDQEKALAAKIDKLWREIEFDWHREWKKCIVLALVSQISMGNEFSGRRIQRMSYHVCACRFIADASSTRRKYIMRDGPAVAE